MIEETRFGASSCHDGFIRRSKIVSYATGCIWIENWEISGLHFGQVVLFAPSEA